MPRGTRVERCVRKVKKSGRDVNPYAVCQASTKQSYATGKKLESNMKYYLTSKGQELLDESILKKTKERAQEFAGKVKEKAKRHWETFNAIGAVLGHGPDAEWRQRRRRAEWRNKGK